MEQVDYSMLESRVGRLHLKQRVGIQTDHGSQVFGRGRTFFHIENWYSIHSVIRTALRCFGLHEWGRRNMKDLRIRHHEVDLAHLPEVFNGFTILQLSDLHLDINSGLADVLIRRIREVEYDLCVLTGDYRANTYGAFDVAFRDLTRILPHITTPVYGILGNHDAIEMVPALEEMGVRMLLNESAVISLDGSDIFLAGIDDPHYYKTDNLEKAAHDVPHDAASILLSHSPEIYRRAAHVDFDLMLCGHTHGGQICLPGGIALIHNAHCPRRMGAGSWRYHNLRGYTSVGSGASVVDVRLNCPPEITLHHLRVAWMESR